MALGTVWLTASAAAATPTASSFATDREGVKHTAARAFDGQLSTGWAEGEMGDGEGSWIEVRFDRAVDVRTISLFAGNLAGPNRVIREYGRPKVVTLVLDVGADEPITKQERLLDPGSRAEPLRHDVQLEADGVRSMRILVDEAYPGGIHSDMYLAEVAINMLSAEPAPAVARVSEWLASDAASKAVAAQRDAVVALFDAIEAEEFGDRESLFQLMDWAADGAPYLRQRVAKSVPVGFRLAALQPDKTSIEALLKLKDSNAIPAIQRASLRTTGGLSADLAKRAQMFEAYKDLKGGANLPAPPWGQSGFSKGSLQALGEPLDIVVDSFGGVFVADVANHRVQRFNMQSGLVDKVFGAADPGMTDVWFYKKREFYAAGSQPGDASGQFIHPVDLAIVPNKRAGDSLLVLDAAGRVTLISAAGSVVDTFKADFESPIGPAVGGEGHVLYTKDRVVVLYGAEVATFSMEPFGTELSRFQINDRVPNSAVAFKDGKIGIATGKELVLYSLDGFRHGDVLLGSLTGTFQDWAVTLDEDGKLWAVTDSGDVIKFKRPSKIDFQVRLTEFSLAVPRLAVFDDLVFVTYDDKVIKEDALEIKARSDAGDGAGNQLSLDQEL